MFDDRRSGVALDNQSYREHLLEAVQWSDVCIDGNELTLVCGNVVMEDTTTEGMKQDCSDVITNSTEGINDVTISCVLFARFVESHYNVLFRDGSCNMSPSRVMAFVFLLPLM